LLPSRCFCSPADWIYCRASCFYCPARCFYCPARCFYCPARCFYCPARCFYCPADCIPSGLDITGPVHTTRPILAVDSGFGVDPGDGVSIPK
jgi:hypothetical protein